MAKKQKVRVVQGKLVCEYPGIAKSHTFDLTELPPSIYIKCDAADHGMEQKFGDAQSGGTALDKFNEVPEIWASLKSGEWNRTAAPDRTPEILAAVAKLKKLTYDQAAGILKDGKGGTLKPTEADVKEWGTHPEVRLQIQVNRTEKAKENLAKQEKQELKVTFK